jgi:putative DNA methylase
MLWDFADVNPLAGAAGDIGVSCEGVAKGLMASYALSKEGFATQADASTQGISQGKVISTDPPYYDNIGYADLSDFYYVWLRSSLRPVYPDLFATLAVPKAEELVATPYRHGSKEKAETFFLDGMTRAMHRLAEQAHPAFPVTIYYAFKQSESETDEGTASTGWETFLDAVIRSGFGISGTWPLRTERDGRPVGNGTNALASSIVLVCRKRPATAPTATCREFVAALKAELPAALADLQRGNIAPVDLAQAAIGPGMAVYTRYAQVLDAQGKALSVREALALINETLDEALAEQEGDFDADSRWALTWFDQHGFDEGEYGTAEQLSKSKNTSVAGMVEAGIVDSKRGKVRLYRPEDLPADWDPATDPRLSAWEVVHHLIRVVGTGGEGAAAALVTKLGAKAEVAASWPIASIPPANARSATARRSPTTAWCRAGRDRPPCARRRHPHPTITIRTERGVTHGYHQSRTRRQGARTAQGGACPLRRPRGHGCGADQLGADGDRAALRRRPHSQQEAHRRMGRGGAAQADVGGVD